jgi:hypothetical protein
MTFGESRSATIPVQLPIGRKLRYPRVSFPILPV